jgi:hypothetical protein
MATFKVSVRLFLSAGWFSSPFFSDTAVMLLARSYSLYRTGLLKNITTVQKLVAFIKVQNCILEAPQFQFRPGDGYHIWDLSSCSSAPPEKGRNRPRTTSSIYYKFPISISIWGWNPILHQRSLHGPWPGSTDNVRVRAGFGPGLNYTNKTLYRTFRAFSGHYFLAMKKVFLAALMLVTQSGSGNKSHQQDFLGDFRSCPLPEIVRDNAVQTWHPISLYRSSNAKITSHVLGASLSNSFEDYWY